MTYITDKEIDNLRGETGRALAREEKVRLVIEPHKSGLQGCGANIPWEGGLNGHFFRIPRGVEVEIPESLAALIRQNAAVTELAGKLVSEYKRGRGKKLST